MGRPSGVCAHVSLGRSVGMGLSRAPVVPKQAFLASKAFPGPACEMWPKSMILTPAVAEHYKPHNPQHRAKSGGGISDPRPTPTRNFRQQPPVRPRTTRLFARAATCAPKSTKSQQQKSHVHSGIRTCNRKYAYISTPPAPLATGYRPPPCWF